MGLPSQDIRAGFETAFIDNTVVSNPSYKSQLLLNDYKEGKKVLCALTEELSKCDSFYISVAFITMSGLTPLLQVLKELNEKGITGRILTTDYLTFSEPRALEKLNEFPNVDVRMYCVDNNGEGFHTKGYIFEQENLYKIIIGSSNLTASALTKNKEWNTKIVSTKEGEYAHQVLDEFELLWHADETLQFDDFIEEYKLKYKIVQDQKKLVRAQPIPKIADFKLKPNSMQVAFINNLKSIINDGADRALLISATGTGKTFASAFAMRELEAKRVLFIVHREQILKQARNTFNRVFDNSVSMGIISGNTKEWDSDFVFSTVQMMSKDSSLERYNTQDFDYIIIDEVHRAGSESYHKIIDYFKPKMLLGMTASPERSDDFDIFNLFDHNIAHEIRLQDALEEDLLCPFHYFGITDFQAIEEYCDGGEKLTNSNSKSDLRDFNLLTCDERVDYIIEQISYYSYSGDRPIGLVFCSSLDEASRLSELFNERGFKTRALSGETPLNKRMEAVELLTSDCPEHLDYLFTVDIFNEGVDIPEVNQVIMLRPTESPIVFVQQLGRGLRKSDNKDYVVIIDFIGNYQNNFMIPVALSGDRSYNKDNLRRVMREGNRTIPGCSSIHFDEISRKKIYSSIDAQKFSEKRFLRKAYQDLKYKLGKIPTLFDFEDHGSIDVQLILNSFGSYYEFLNQYESEYTYEFDSQKRVFLKYISTKMGSGKRPHEMLALGYLLSCHLNNVPSEDQDLKLFLEEEINSAGYIFDDNTADNLRNILTANFLTGGIKKGFASAIFIDEVEGRWQMSHDFSHALEDDEFFRMVDELVAYWLDCNEKYYSDTYEDTSFCLYKKYNYEDVCRLYNWDQSLVPLNIGGYKFDKKTNTFPVFINYEKDDSISESINYHDRFISQTEFIGISKSGRTIKSKDVQDILHSYENGVRMDLFVRKNKDDNEAKEFYYLGKINPSMSASDFVEINMSDGSNAVEIPYRLKTSVRDDIYDYIVN